MRTAVWMAGALSARFEGDGSRRSGETGTGLKMQEQHTHVKTSSNAGTLQGLVLGVLSTSLHETGHLILGELDLSILKSVLVL